MSLEYRGHLFDACVCLEDVAKVKLDPTGTSGIRSRFNTTMMLRWRRVRITVREALVSQNLLGLANGKASPVMVNAMVGGVSRVQMFQRWIDSVLVSMVSGDTMFVRPFIQAGYDAGIQFAETEVGAKPPQSSDDRVGTLAELARVEIQGICEAVSQQAVRAVASALLHAVSAAKLARQIQGIIDSVGVTRSTAMVELLVVKAFGEATLDVYSGHGVTQVGLIPESRAARRIGDAARTGPGSRVPRSRTPSGSTIGRITRFERSFERTSRVNVQTAEDDRVCPICEDIADDGPYTINRARALIPAHPRCRCVFVPA